MGGGEPAEQEMTHRERLLDGTIANPQLQVAVGRDVIPTVPLTHVTQAAPVRLGRLIGDSDALKAAAAKVHVCALLDCSGSEYGTNGDRKCFRMACMRSMVRLMRLTGGGTFDICHWGSRPIHSFGPASVATHFNDIDRALQHDPGSMGGNDFPAALRMSDACFRRVGAEISLAIGVTDGLEEITPAMAAAIGALPEGSVHVLLVPGGNCPESLAAQWQQFPLGSFTRLSSDNVEMARTVGQIYAAAVGGELGEIREPLAAPVAAARARRRFLRRRAA